MNFFLRNTRLNILGTISFYVYPHFGTTKCHVLRWVQRITSGSNMLHINVLCVLFGTLNVIPLVRF